MSGRFAPITFDTIPPPTPSASRSFDVEGQPAGTPSSSTGNTSTSQQLPMALDPQDEKSLIRFLVSDRVYGYPHTSGTMLSNYVRFVMNKHPLLSIFLHNRRDPFNTVKRFIVFVCTLCACVYFSYLLLSTTFVYQIAVCRDGCTSTNTNNICLGGASDGISSSSYFNACKYYSPWMLSAACGCVIVVYGSMLRILASCYCLQGRDNSQTCLSSFLTFGGFVLLLFSALSVAMVVWVIIATALSGASFDIFITILVSKAFSFGEWFLWTLPYFLIRYPCDKQHFLKKMKEKMEDENQSKPPIVVEPVEIGSNR